MTAVGVNLLWLRPGQVGGSEEYLVRQLTGLAALDHGLEVTLFALSGFVQAHSDLASQFEVVVAPVSGRQRAARVAVEASWLAARTRRLSLVHHGGGTLPAIGSRPAVLTIHDLQYLTFPGFVSRSKLAFLRSSVPRAARRAAVICVPSSFVRSTVVEAFGVDPDRVVVVPHGLDRASAVVSGADDLRSRYQLPERYVVYPAVTWPHKDHATLLRALAEPTMTAAGIGAVLLGGRGPSEQLVSSLVDELGLAGRVCRPGRVSAADRDGFYASAVALAFPSRYEGFGAPVLEAMAAGCPVVAAASTALPEVVGDAGVLVEPRRPEALAEALVAVADDVALRSRLIEAGRARAATFDVERSARALLVAYRQGLAAPD